MPEDRDAQLAKLLNRATAAAAIAAAALYLGLVWLHQFRLAPMAGGLQAPDVHAFGYDAETVKLWIEALGRDGRLLFLQAHTFFLDLLFPPAFAFAAAMLTLWTGRRVGWFSRLAGLRRFVIAVAAPAFYLGFDWSENLAVARMVADPMTISDAAAAHASMLSVGKWIFVGLSLALPAALFFIGRRRADP